jgi:hypothetical protein
MHLGKLKSREKFDSVRKGSGVNLNSGPSQNKLDQSLDQVFTWYSFQPVKFPLNNTRDRIVDELLRTEQLYVKNMITMIKVFRSIQLNSLELTK